MNTISYKDEELQKALREVLFKASKGSGSKRHFLTSYQILSRLPDTTKYEVMLLKGEISSGASLYRAAALHLVQVLGHMDDVEKIYIDTAGLMFIVESGLMVDGGGSTLCALFRIP